MFTIQFPKSIDRTWWLILGLIVFTGVLLQLTGYNYAFPYIVEHDEARIFWNAYNFRLGRWDLMDLPGYSPGYFWLHAPVQLIAEQVTGRLAELDQWVTINLMRLLSIFANALSALIIAIIAKLLTNHWGGWLAAFMWITSSLIFEQTAIALTESWQVLFYVLAFWGCIIALRDKSPRAAVLSVVAGLVAIVFKYSAFPVLGLGVGATLWLILREENKRLWLKTFGIQWAFIIGTAIYLLFIYGATSLGGHPETSAFLSGNLDRLLDPTWWQRIFGNATRQLHIGLNLGLLLIALGTFCHFLISETWQRVAWILGLGLWVIHNALILQYLVYHIGIPRYVSSGSGLLAIFIFGSLIQIARLTLRYLPSKWPVIAVVVFLLGYQWVPQQLNEALKDVQNHAKPHTGGALSTWALGMIDQEMGILVDPSLSLSLRNRRVFERSSGGWQGQWMDIKYRSVNEQPIAAWQSDNFGYYLDSTEDHLDNPDLLLLKQFPPVGEEENWQGWDAYFYRLGGIQNETDVILGETIQLVGFDLSGSQISAGDTLNLTPYWQALQQPSANYSLYVHLYRMETRDVLAQADGAPVGGTRLTPTWDDPNEILVGQTFNLALPADLPDGEYRLALGLYDFQTGTRLLTPDGQDFVILETIQIEAN